MTSWKISSHQKDIDREFILTPNFTGRSNDIININSILRNSDSGKIVISGLPGVGKTQLVTAFLEHYKENFSKVKWMNTQFPRESKLVKFKKGIMKISKLYTSNDVDDQLKKKVLIFDNVVNGNEILEYLTKINNDNESLVIIITRNSIKEEWQGMKHYILNVLVKEDAENFIANQLQINIDDEYENVEILAKTLGYLPLALQQAVSYILSKNISISSYLKLFSEEPRKLLSYEGFENFDSYQNTVFGNFKFIIGSFENDVSELFSVLSYITQYKSASIDCLHILEPDKANMGKILNSLERYSIVRKHEKFVSSFILAGLVNRIIVRESKNINVFKKICDFCMEISENVKYSEITTDIIHYFNHIMLNIENMLELEVNSEFSEIVKHLYYFKILYRIWKPYCKIGNFEVAKNILHKYLLLSVEKYGDKHEEKIEVSEIINELAMIYHNLKEYAISNILYENILPEFQRDLGEDHSEIGYLLLKIAENEFRLKNYEKSDCCIKKAYEIYKKNFGENHEETAVILHYMAILKCKQNDGEEANSLFEISYRILSENLSDNYARVTYLIYNWGKNEQSMGNYQAADKKYQKCLTVSKQIFGDNHPFTKKVNKNIKYNMQLSDNNTAENCDSPSTSDDLEWVDGFRGIFVTDETDSCYDNLNEQDLFSLLNSVLCFLEENLDKIEMKLQNQNSVKEVFSNECFLIKYSGVEKKITDKMKSTRNMIESHQKKYRKRVNIEFMEEYSNFHDWIKCKKIAITDELYGADLKTIQNLLVGLQSHKTDIEDYLDHFNSLNELGKHIIKGNPSSQEATQQILNSIESEWNELHRCIVKRENDLENYLEYITQYENLEILVSDFIKRYFNIIELLTIPNDLSGFEILIEKYEILEREIEAIKPEIKLFESKAANIATRYPIISVKIEDTIKKLLEPFMETLNAISKNGNQISSAVTFFHDFKSLSSWIRKKTDEIHEKRKISNDIESMKKQIDDHDKIKKEINEKLYELLPFYKAGDTFISENHLLSNRIQYNIDLTRKYFAKLNETWTKDKDMYSNYYLLLTKEQSAFAYPNNRNEEFIDLDIENIHDVSKTDESFNETIITEAVSDTSMNALHVDSKILEESENVPSKCDEIKKSLKKLYKNSSWTIHVYLLQAKNRFLGGSMKKDSVDDSNKQIQVEKEVENQQTNNNIFTNDNTGYVIIIVILLILIFFTIMINANK